MMTLPAQASRNSATKASTVQQISARVAGRSGCEGLGEMARSRMLVVSSMAPTVGRHPAPPKEFGEPQTAVRSGSDSGRRMPLDEPGVDEVTDELGRGVFHRDDPIGLRTPRQVGR